MRRTCLALLAIILISLMVPPDALALIDWLEHMSGPGKFFGWQLNTRLWCFGGQDFQEDARQYRKKMAAALDARVQDTVKKFQEAYDSRDVGRDDKSIIGADQKALKSLHERLPALSGLTTSDAIIKWLGELKNSSQAFAYQNDPDRTTARSLFRKLDDLEKLKDEDISTLFDRSPTFPENMAFTKSKENLLTSLEATHQANNLVQTKNMGMPVTTTACPIDKDIARTSSLDLDIRMLHSVGDNHGFAGGHQIELVTMVPTFSWRPLHGNPKLDYVDLATGAGMYWFSSSDDPGGFDSFSGWILEPIRFDIHFPQVLTAKPKWWWLAVPSLHYGLAIFPGGFDKGAFGDKNGRPSPRIPAEWEQHLGIFVDLSPVLYALKQHKMDSAH